eukprot:1075710-Amphidinium_carterae.1
MHHRLSQFKRSTLLPVCNRALAQVLWDHLHHRKYVLRDALEKYIGAVSDLAFAYAQAVITYMPRHSTEARHHDNIMVHDLTEGAA